jgi:glycosyltransferase A (GT-A) superfamily protein (DUF2064 family)
MKSAPRRCVMLFARPASVEARVKGLPAAEPLFRRIQDDIAAAATEAGADLVPAPQRGATFGEKVRNAFHAVRALGYDQIVVVAGDVPGLGPDQLVQAFAALRHTTAVLGPSPDGGVYLIGCRGPADALLEGVRWNTPHVLADLRQRAADAVLLEPLADLDRAVDLTVLAASDAVPAELRDAIRALLIPPLAAPRPAPPRAAVVLAFDHPRGPPVELPAP